MDRPLALEGAPIMEHMASRRTTKCLILVAKLAKGPNRREQSAGRTEGRPWRASTKRRRALPHNQHR